MTIGNKIKEIRKRLSLSQEDLAELLNVSRQAITKWETENGIPDITNLQQLSNTFGITVDSLLKEDNLDPYTLYKYELTLKEYSYVVDTLTIIIYIQNHIDNKETMNKGLNAYFKDYPQKININDDFNTNYDMLSFIFQCEDINVIKLILKNLIQKNIYFLEEN